MSLWQCLANLLVINPGFYLTGADLVHGMLMLVHGHVGKAHGGCKLVMLVVHLEVRSRPDRVMMDLLQHQQWHMVKLLGIGKTTKVCCCGLSIQASCNVVNCCICQWTNRSG